MAKRPPSPPVPPTPKRHHTNEYDMAVVDMHRMIQKVATSLASEPHDEVLAHTLCIISRKAPPEACIAKEVAAEADDLIKHNPDLKEALDCAIHSGEYKDLLSMSILKAANVTLNSVSGRIARNVRAIFKAFSAPYLGGFPQTILAAVDRYFPQKSYNKAICIIQSFGAGKSRSVAEAAKLRFTFLFNLGQELPVEQYAYPPPDNCVRDYLLPWGGGPSRDRYAAFLCSLFACAGKYISDVDRKGIPLARWWYEFLNAGEHEFRVGVKRMKFYKEVIEGAESLVCEGGDIIARLQASCEKFVELLDREYLRDDPQATPLIPCLLVFDEAQELAANEDKTYYHDLGSVLHAIRAHRVFSVFLSTNAGIQLVQFHPHLDPEAQQVYPPLAMFPFDVFARNLSDELLEDERFALNEFCTLDVMSRFGRPLWHTLLKNGYDPISIFLLAAAKLNTTEFPADELAQFACLAIRISLDIDTSHPIADTTNTELVESHMRVVFAIPAHSKFMCTGTLSEPVLAEEAAEILHDGGVWRENMGEFAPRVLLREFERGFLAQEQRGEAVARLLWTMAHDETAVENFVLDEEHIMYHVPIPVLQFLHCLFPEEYWEEIDNATPIGDSKGPTLSMAFENAYVSFSHFMDASAHDVDLRRAYKLLIRGAALVCSRKTSIDFLAPIFFGSPESTTFSRSHTSVMQAQVKNCNEPEAVDIDPTLVQDTLPVLSLVHELGTSVSSVTSSPSSLGGATVHPRHYVIVSRGCTSETFAVIPSSTDDVYRMLLGSDWPTKDCSRADIPECLSLFRQMDPCRELERARPGELGREENNFSWFGKDV